MSVDGQIVMSVVTEKGLIASVKNLHNPIRNNGCVI